MKEGLFRFRICVLVAGKYISYSAQVANFRPQSPLRCGGGGKDTDNLRECCCGDMKEVGKEEVPF